MEKDADLMARMILLSGDPRVGFLTNPESRNKPNHIEVNGEKIVCLAQGGECRHNPEYYSPRLEDRKSWTTPIIDETCPNECWYKMLVCDNHPKDCPTSRTYYPQYNKFAGQFGRYCREFSRLEKKADKQGDTSS